MLNKDNVRELAYVVQIDGIEPHPNADRLEIAHINGWNCVVGKGEFKDINIGIYFEIDSQLPIDQEPWKDMEFLVSKHGKIKTQKIRGAVSQGFLINPNDIPGFEVDETFDGQPVIADHDRHAVYAVGDFLTERLGVTYAVPEDNVRKSNGLDKYKKMAQRNQKLAKTKWWKALYKTEFGKKVLFIFFGKKRDKVNAWPSWVVKTDEERVQNMPYILNYDEPWIVTEKIDGTSATYTARRSKKMFGEKVDFYVCSRNVVFDKPDKQCFYEQNYYTQIAEKYNIEYCLKAYLEMHPEAEWVTLQGEIYGPGIQKRDYSMSNIDFMGFNFITSDKGRWNSWEAKTYVEKTFNIPWVPILYVNYILPDTVNEILEFATDISKIDGLPREGVVFRDYDGKKSFKAVSNEYLMKYHG